MPAVLLEYVGGTGLTVIGPVSGLRYRFGAPGTRLAIDARDKPLLIGLAQLREVR